MISQYKTAVARRKRDHDG